MSEADALQLIVNDDKEEKAKMERQHKENVSGWREWLALPEIGIPGIEADIDTCFEFSTLQTSFVEHYQQNGDLWVRFGVTPLPERDDIRIVSQAPVKKHQTFPVSECHEETLFVIESPVKIGQKQTVTELVLQRQKSAAASVNLRLGRNALKGLDLLVNPQKSHLFGEPDESLYRSHFKTC